MTTIIRKKAKTTTIMDIVKLDMLGIPNSERNEAFTAITRVEIPVGHTIKADDTGDCYECCFCCIEGFGADEEMSCMHPTPAKTGCADNNIVFVLDSDEN